MVHFSDTIHRLTAQLEAWHDVSWGPWHSQCFLGASIFPLGMHIVVQSVVAQPIKCHAAAESLSLTADLAVQVQQAVCQVLHPWRVPTSQVSTCLHAKLWSMQCGITAACCCLVVYAAPCLPQNNHPHNMIVSLDECAHARCEQVEEEECHHNRS